MKITLSQLLLCNLIANTIFGKQLKSFDNVDFDEVYKESLQQSVAMTAFQNVSSLPVSAELRKNIEARSSKKLIKNIANFNSHNYLGKLLSKNEIPYCILKGVASAHYYPVPLARHMGDVDFYVDKEYIDKTISVLKNDGFEINENDSDHHIAFHKKNVHYELHFGVSGVPKGEMAKPVLEYLTDIVDSSESINDDLVSVMCPSPFHHGLVMLLHMQRHMISMGIGLRHLCDWAVFVNSFETEEFLKIFREKLDNIGLWKFTQVISLAAAMYIGLDRAQWMGDDEKLAAEIMSDIFISGNFGKKSPARVYEGMLLHNAVKDENKKTRIQKGFGAINNLTRTHWPLSRKLPLLYPVGWIYFPLRYAVRVARGKRFYFNVFTTYKKSGERRDLYSKLKLFEKE